MQGVIVEGRSVQKDDAMPICLLPLLSHPKRTQIKSGSVFRERYQSVTPAQAVANIAAESAKVFTKFDALKGYHQIPMDEWSELCLADSSSCEPRLSSRSIKIDVWTKPFRLPLHHGRRDHNYTTAMKNNTHVLHPGVGERHDILAPGMVTVVIHM